MTSPAGDPIRLADFTARLTAVRDELDQLIAALPDISPRLNMAPTSRRLSEAAAAITAEAAAMVEADDIITGDVPLDVYLPNTESIWYTRYLPSPRQVALLARTAGNASTITFREAMERNPYLTSTTVTVPDLPEPEPAAGEDEDHWYRAESTEAEWREAFDIARRRELHLLDVPLTRFYNTVYSLTCPYCQALPRQLCRTNGGYTSKAHEPHKDRQAAAAVILTEELRAETSATAP
ncbi:hypothetical protein [Georgenia yuyongxinii]|uniref:DNA-binding phage zinc finger domain-containing protein n=1 Tax=Georgenia yuyongxinii TaxID=2589797 RepID=A0A552WS01_9MICO|nr:hypothetical protein [Georgenia yuyongxinii]TRW45600.1 hypothetical protein FJ693_08690 [Georgenia yuyongxinii]